MFLQQLRLKTKAAHESLELNPLTGALTTSDLQRETYALILKKFHVFYRDAWTVLEAWPGMALLPFNLNGCKRHHLALADLENLGLLDAAVEAELQAARATLPHLDSLERALGCLYVLEGSTLGGQIIARNVKTVFGLGNGQHHEVSAFFSSDGSQTAARWRKFLGHFVEFAESASEFQRDAIVAGALDTFSAFESWLKSDTLRMQP